MKTIYSFSPWRLLFRVCCLVSVVLCLFSPITLSAQSGSWVWVNGDATANSQGNYGVQGYPDVNNNPPALYQAQQWTDKEGNFWMFGGVDSAQYEHSDLWEYVPSNNTWTWVNGPGVGRMPGVYGRLGVPSPANVPGGRGWGCATWTDSIGDLWLFGGRGCDSLGNVDNLSDLWRYDIGTNEWTWMGGPAKGNQQGVYGNLYQSGASFVPPPRSEANTAWTDNNNNLWLFGGYGYNIFSGCYNDMWRYNIAIGQWAWMGGTKVINGAANYGVLGVEGPGNVPPVRNSYTHWVDSNYLYFAGGGDFTSHHQFNDVWRFNLNTNYFTWVGGDSGDAPVGKYTHFCSTDFGDKPVGTLEHRSTQLNACSKILFMWGGQSDSGALLNDLWSFDLHKHQWRWVNGEDSIAVSGNFGTQGLSSPTNMPPGLMGTCFWSDYSGNLWLWGGQCAMGSSANYINALNSMWEYVPDQSCFPSDTSGVINITASNTTICPGDSAQLCAPQGLSNYNWNNNDTAACIYVKVEGSYYVVANSFGNCASGNVNVTVFHPSPVTVSVSGDTLTGYNSSNYQWLLNNVPIPGATSRIYIATTSGSYSLQVVDTNGCMATSTPVFVTGITDLADNSISIYPNPSTGSWQLAVGNELLGSTIQVYDATGRVVFKSQIINNTSQIALPNVAAGVYELRITSGIYNIVRKLVKT